MKKLAFFNQKHGLTLGTNAIFQTYKKIFHGQKKFPSYLDHYLTLYLVLFKAKTNNEKICMFWPKAWFNFSLWKNAIFRTFRNFPFIVKNTFFFLHRTLLNLISNLVLTKNKWKRIRIFWPIAWVKPFGKMPFLGFSKHFVFIVKKTFLVSLQS